MSAGTRPASSRPVSDRAAHSAAAALPACQQLRGIALTRPAAGLPQQGISRGVWPAPKAATSRPRTASSRNVNTGIEAAAAGSAVCKARRPGSSPAAAARHSSRAAGFGAGLTGEILPMPHPQRHTILAKQYVFDPPMFVSERTHYGMMRQQAAMQQAMREADCLEPPVVVDRRRHSSPGSGGGRSAGAGSGGSGGSGGSVAPTEAPHYPTIPFGRRMLTEAAAAAHPRSEAAPAHGASISSPLGLGCQPGPLVGAAGGSRYPAGCPLRVACWPAATAALQEHADSEVPSGIFGLSDPGHIGMMARGGCAAESTDQFSRALAMGAHVRSISGWARD